MCRVDAVVVLIYLICSGFQEHLQLTRLAFFQWPLNTPFVGIHLREKIGEVADSSEWDPTPGVAHFVELLHVVDWKMIRLRQADRR
jgi:hypothetical protein